ncbi:CLAVATA3/ESR (CLE)-related protein 9 [Linum grandiflorum]
MIKSRRQPDHPRKKKSSYTAAGDHQDRQEQDSGGGGGGGGDEIEIDPRYGVEKRLVPSGPNPLHN